MRKKKESVAVVDETPDFLKPGFKPRTMCANPNCPKHNVYQGGTFKVRLSDGATFCEECFGSLGSIQTAKNLWDFTTTHFTGYPVHVRSRGHLDELCKTHGVSNHARENYERNW